MKPRCWPAALLGPPRRRPAIRDLMAITAFAALAYAAVTWLDGLDQMHHVRVGDSLNGFERDGWDPCGEIHPIHRWLTPVVYGGIGVGVWSLVYLYAPRRLDRVLFAVQAAVVLA